MFCKNYSFPGGDIGRFSTETGNIYVGFLGFTNSLLAHSLSKSLLPSEDAFKTSCKN